MIPKKPAPDLIWGGTRFSEEIMLQHPDCCSRRSAFRLEALALEKTCEAGWRAAQQPAQRIGIADQSVLRVVAKHGGERGPLILAHAAGAGARFPRRKRLVLGAAAAAERCAELRRDFGLT